MLRGVIDRDAFIQTLEQVQSLLLRRTVVGVTTNRLVARLCRARERGQDSLVRAIARITPSDERVRVALRYGDLPHARYVLGRLADVDCRRATSRSSTSSPSPPARTGAVTAGGRGRTTAKTSRTAIARSRRPSATSTLLEEPLAERALDAVVPREALRPSTREAQIAATRELADVGAWGTAAIGQRTARLTGEFLRIWARPATVGIDDDDLTPILDAQRRRGWPRGWQREFEYVEYRGEHWEVHDVKYLFNRVFKRLWADSREHVVAYSARRGGPIFAAQAWNGQWDVIDEGRFLYMGWDSKYMLTAVQGVLEEAGLAPEVFVKYSYIGAAM